MLHRLGRFRTPRRLVSHWWFVVVALTLRLPPIGGHRDPMTHQLCPRWIVPPRQGAAGTTGLAHCSTASAASPTRSPRRSPRPPFDSLMYKGLLVAAQLDVVRTNHLVFDLDRAARPATGNVGTPSVHFVLRCSNASFNIPPGALDSVKRAAEVICSSLRCAVQARLWVLTVAARILFCHHHDAACNRIYRL